MYADDTKIYSEINNSHDGYNLQEDINAIVQWCCDWKLSLNFNKCAIVTFTLQTKPIYYQYKISAPLLRINEVKDLGVTINSKLTYSSHISTIVNSAFKILGMLKRKSSKFKLQETVLIFYKVT